MERELWGFVAGFVIATITSPVGVSGVVFLLPVQLSVFNVPNPQVTPTNLLYNVLSGPGALIRYVRQGQLRGPLARSMVLGSAPRRRHRGRSAGLRRQRPERLQTHRRGRALAHRCGHPVANRSGSDSSNEETPPSKGTISVAAFLVGIVGGIYGIGGGSILGPILVASGMALSQVAPAALASTFVTSVVGGRHLCVAAGEVVWIHRPRLATLVIACGLGGLVGGYLGASLYVMIARAVAPNRSRSSGDRPRGCLRHSGGPLNALSCRESYADWRLRGHGPVSRR